MRDPDCVFCKIVSGAIPSEFLWEDDELIAIRDIAPAAPLHALVIPRLHIPSANALRPDDAKLVGHLIGVGTILAKREGLGEADRGYRLIVNCGPEGGQSVGHLHVHVLGGRQLGHLNI